MSQSQYEPAVNLSKISTEALKKELADRGFAVIERARLLKVNFEQSLSAMEMADTEHVSSVHALMAHGLGHEALKAGGMVVTQEQDGIDYGLGQNTRIRLTMQIVMPKPEPDV